MKYLKFYIIIAVFVLLITIICLTEMQLNDCLNEKTRTICKEKPSFEEGFYTLKHSFCEYLAEDLNLNKMEQHISLNEKESKFIWYCSDYNINNINNMEVK